MGFRHGCWERRWWAQSLRGKQEKMWNLSPQSLEAVFSLVILSGMTGQMLVKSAPSMPTMSQDRDQ